MTLLGVLLGFLGFLAIVVAGIGLFLTFTTASAIWMLLGVPLVCVIALGAISA